MSPTVISPETRNIGERVRNDTEVCVEPILTVFLGKKVNFTAVITTFMKCPKIRKNDDVSPPISCYFFLPPALAG